MDRCRFLLGTIFGTAGIHTNDKMITKDTKMDIDATVEEKPFSDQLRWFVFCKTQKGKIGQIWLKICGRNSQKLENQKPGKWSLFAFHNPEKCSLSQLQIPESGNFRVSQSGKCLGLQKVEIILQTVIRVWKHQNIYKKSTMVDWFIPRLINFYIQK